MIKQSGVYLGVYRISVEMVVQHMNKSSLSPSLLSFKTIWISQDVQSISINLHHERIFSPQAIMKFSHLTTRSLSFFTASRSVYYNFLTRTNTFCLAWIQHLLFPPTCFNHRELALHSRHERLQPHWVYTYFNTDFRLISLSWLIWLHEILIKFSSAEQISLFLFLFFLAKWKFWLENFRVNLVTV